MKSDWRHFSTLAIVLALTGASCLSFTPFRPRAMPCIQAQRSGPSSAEATTGGAPVVSVQSGHSGAVTRLQITPDGQYAIAAEQSPARVKLWQLSTGREVLTYPLSEQMAWGANLSSDGKRLLVDYPNRGIEVFDVMTGTSLQRCGDEVGVSPRAAIGRYSADGKHVSSWNISMNPGQPSHVEIWDLQSGDKVASFAGQMGLMEQFSPQGDALVFVADKNTVQVADVKRPAIIASMKVPDGVAAVGFSWDGRTVYAANQKGLLFSFDPATGASQSEGIKLLDGKFAISLLPLSDGKRLLVGDFDGGLGTFHLESKQWTRFASAGRPAAALSPDGLRLFVGTPGKYFVWRLADGSPQSVWMPETEDRTENAVFLPDGKRVAVVRRATLKLHAELLDVEQKKTLWRGPEVDTMFGDLGEVAVTPDARFVLATFGRITGTQRQVITQVFDAGSGDLLQTIALHAPGAPVWQSPAVGLVDGKLAIAKREGTEKDVILVIDAVSGKTVGRYEPGITLFGMTAPPDGRRLYLSGQQLTQSGEESKVTRGIWSYDLERKTTRSEAEMEARDAALIVQRAFAGPKRQYLIGGQSFGSFENNQLGKMTSFFELHPETGFPKRIADQQLRWASFTADGARMLWVADDGFVHLTSATTGDEILRIASFDDGEWVIMNPAGFFASSKKGSQYLSVRDGNQFFAIDQFYEKLYRPDVVLASLTGKTGEAPAPTVNLAQVLQAGPPPSVRVVSPAPGEQAKRDVEIEVELTDSGGGFGRIEWRINGAVIGVAGERGVRAKAKAKEQRKETKLISLSPGENVIEVVAYNAEGTASSAPAVLNLSMKDEISEPPALYLLGIGVNKYRDRTLQLSYAVPDAQSLSESFQKAAGKVFTHVETKLVTDADATATGIAAAFVELAGKVKSNDVFVLFVAGHGVTTEGRYHFLPSDFRYVNEASVEEKGINQDDLQKWMSSIQAKKSLVLLDTCNSGSFVQAQAVSRGIQEKTAIDKLTRATGRATIAASTDTQVALEGLEGHGVFTWAVLDALRKADHDYGNRDGVTTTGELAAFINEQVPDLTYKKWGYEQVPQVNLHGREFPIGVAEAK